MAVFSDLCPASRLKKSRLLLAYPPWDLAPQKAEPERDHRSWARAPGLADEREPLIGHMDTALAERREP